MFDSAQDAASEPLYAQIANLLKPFGARTAVAARRLAHTPNAGGPPRAASTMLLRAETPLPMGELARLGIAVELLRRVDLGQFSLDELIDDPAHGRQPDTPTDGAAAWTLDEICARMLAAEEPAATVATTALVELVGLGEINESLSRLKLSGTQLVREENSGRALVTHRASTTTASDMLTLLGLLSGSAIPGAAWLRVTLAAQARLPALRAALPTEAELAHLPALAGRNGHDMGWLRGPGGGCAYCVLIADADDSDHARQVLVDVPRLLWSAWCAG